MWFQYFRSKIHLFHAVCAVLKEEQPDIFRNFKNGL